MSGQPPTPFVGRKLAMPVPLVINFQRPFACLLTMAKPVPAMP